MSNDPHTSVKEIFNERAVDFQKVNVKYRAAITLFASNISKF